jgi:RNA polymerase sigma-70 factor (ECF subfamily)
MAARAWPWRPAPLPPPVLAISAQRANGNGRREVRTPSQGSRATGELVKRARRGDAAAFEVLVRRHYGAAYAVALALTGNTMDAEDVVQDAFVRALERLDSCQPDRFSGWLCTIVRNHAHTVRARERLRAGEELELADPPGRDRADRAAERNELVRTLEAALVGLSPVQREIVLLHDLEGWRHREIAHALGISEVMTRQHLFQARRTLRTSLARVDLKEYLHG